MELVRNSIFILTLIAVLLLALFGWNVFAALFKYSRGFDAAADMQLSEEQRKLMGLEAKGNIVPNYVTLVVAVADRHKDVQRPQFKRFIVVSNSLYLLCA